MDRRDFLKALGFSIVAPNALASVVQSKARLEDFWSMPRALHLQRGKARKKIVFWQDGQYIDNGYGWCCWFLRDTTANKAIQMDLTLLNILFWMQGAIQQYGVDRPLIINSGYRTFDTNERVGGASKSMHLVGKAVDMRIDGVPTKLIYNLSQYLQRGGAGWYPQKGFVHLDTGRLRKWQG